MAHPAHHDAAASPGRPGAVGASGEGTEPAAGSKPREVLVAVRSAGALHRLLDVLPAFDGDRRIVTRFTLVPGSCFDVDALAALDRAGARTLSWDEAVRRTHDLVLAASPKGDLTRLSGPRVLLPHGAGFNKAVRDDGSAGVPSGFDPHYLLTGAEPWADLHALAHDDQVALLARHCPPAAHRAAVVGDPTLDRLLVSLPHRTDIRARLGTGPRRLVVVLSTWGRESLIARRPGLPAELCALLPYDAYQIALVLHPNEFSRTGEFDLSRRLAPALSAGLLLARPHQEWAALLVAADAVVTDHGSTALYAAALGHPVVGAYDGGSELIPGSPMARLLAAAPRLRAAPDLPDLLRPALAVDTRRHAAEAFTHQGQALFHLRSHLYRLLGLRPPDGPLEAQPFPLPAPTAHRTTAFGAGLPAASPVAFAVRAEVSGDRIAIRRFPAAAVREPVHHLAAEHPAAGPRATQSAAVLWCRAGGSAGPASRTALATVPSAAPTPLGTHAVTWTAAGWTAHVLADMPACRTAVVILPRRRCLLRHRTAGLFGLRMEPHREAGRLADADAAAVASAVHAWLGTASGLPGAPGLPPEPLPPVTPVTLVCDTGPIAVRVHLTAPDQADLDYEL